MVEQKLPRWAKPGWTPKRVLAPLDGSEESERALRKCLPLLRGLKASITLLAVADVESPAELRDPRDVGEPGALAKLQQEIDRSKAATAAATSYLENVQGSLGESIDAVTMVGYGEPSEAIAATAESIDADIVLMATRRESSLVRGIIGSTTARVLHAVRRPVMVVRVEEDGERITDKWPQNILTPLDVSPVSEWAVDPSIALAKATGAELRFVRVTQRIYYPGSGGAIAYAGSGVFFGTELRAEAFEYLAPFVDRARSEGADAYVVARSGSAAGEIVDVARELPDSLIVMTTHARSGFLRMTLGSVADKVVRASARPVLLLPVREAESHG